MVVMDQHRGWELVADEKKRADKVVAAMADSINFATQASTMPPPPPPPAPPAPPGIILAQTLTFQPFISTCNIQYIDK